MHTFIWLSTEIACHTLAVDVTDYMLPEVGFGTVPVHP